MAMDSTAQHCNQELMCSQSETLESMLNVCTKSNQAKTKPKPCDQQALKCPRCDSNNTKFCYYNNYSLTQPRYFCKSCRRYWTKGGTLRNVPVGGGCRKNKRSTSSSSSSSKSRISQDHNQPMITTPPNFPDWINPNIPIISSTDHYNDHHANIGGGAGIFDALRGTGLFNLETPSRNVCYGLMENSNGSAGGLGHEEMGLNYINSHNYLVGFDEEYLSGAGAGAGAGAVNFPWQMMASSNGINGHGLLNTPLM